MKQTGFSKCNYALKANPIRAGGISTVAERYTLYWISELATVDRPHRQRL